MRIKYKAIIQAAIYALLGAATFLSDGNHHALLLALFAGFPPPQL